MKILITGGTGFIGLHTARALLERGDDVVVTQFRVRRDPPFIREQLGGRLAREVVDVSSPDTLADVVAKHRVEGILHLAVPGLGALSPAEDFRVNMLGLLNVLEAARLHGVARVVLASSIAVYGGLRGPFRETDPLPVASASNTGAYKKAWEITALNFAERSGLEIVCARIAQIYGPLYHSLAAAPARLAHAAVRGRDDAGEIFADEAVDYCYVADCAAGLRLLMTAPLVRSRVYNLGSGRATSNREIAEALVAAVPDARPRLVDGRRDAARTPEAYLDLTLIERELGYRPQYDAARAMADYAAWLRANEI